ncbi:hypothetical protein FRC12_012710 [Ceratobasidium sp. 428]|nr:hypothetical protein FRC12_012710 [Ceratobasidium sp. 428]
MFVTPSDCSKPKVLRTFLLAMAQILQCLPPQNGNEDWEVAIFVNCVSLRSPRYSYYVADHRSQTVQWVHQGPREVSPSIDDGNLETSLVKRVSELMRCCVQPKSGDLLNTGDTLRSSQAIALSTSLNSKTCAPAWNIFGVLSFQTSSSESGTRHLITWIIMTKPSMNML